MKRYKYLIKQLTASIMAVAFVCTVSSGAIASAATSVQLSGIEQFTMIEEGIEKNVNIIEDELKLVSWENEDYMTIEQYDIHGVLVDRVIVDKQANTATSSFNAQQGNGELVLSAVVDASVTAAPAPRAASRVDQVKVFNPFTSPVTEKQMRIFEIRASGVTVTYRLPNTGLTAAQFVAGLATNLFVTAAIAAGIFNFLVAGVIVAIANGIVGVFLDIRLAATKTAYSYYGQDSVTLKKSSDYQSGAVYKIIDSESKYLNKSYSTGFIYGDGGKYQIANALCDNLYGVNFEYVTPM